ncbi:MAG: AAA family ATPase [Synechocystis sp.]|nr:AAA family ATPase [Synechocystis sp.]
MNDPQHQFQSLMQAMQEPSFYPHAVETPITCLQTHCSAVFLTGKYAYKLKKPVDFGFLDYSTPAKRQHFLQEELRLNLPIAPDIYRQVLPLYYQHNQWHWGAKTGHAEDYVLQMQQFPQHCLLSSLFEQKKLTDDHIIRLGKRVAEFHQQTPTNEEIMSFGDPDVIWRSVANNFKATEKYIGIVQSQQQFNQIKQFCETFYQQHLDWFKERQTQGKIRECHGDLHLNNLCDWQGKIQLFDRIEFNQPFRFVDVMYDVAFTVMDLDAKNRSDWAYLFLNTYLEQTGDWQGLKILPFYLCRQAYVRAKVTSFLLDDQNLTDQDKQIALNSAQHYYTLAWQYSQRKPGRIILMSGLSGSGKSTLAQPLSLQLPAVWIRSDAVRKQLGGIALHQTGDQELYTPAMTGRVYQTLFTLGKRVRDAGFNVILDAKFDRIQWRSPFVKFAEDQGVNLRIIHCQAPMNVLKQRLHHRQGDISDATVDLLAEQQATWQDFTESEQSFVIEVNTQQDWQAFLSKYSKFKVV